MVAPRHRIPTPAWTELPAADAGGSETFQPFVTEALFRRRVALAGTAPFGSLPDTLSILHDEDSDAPQTSLS
jgi:hypothetical protein